MLHGCDEVAADILASVDPSRFRLMQLKGNDGKNVLHVASNCIGTNRWLDGQTINSRVS